MQGRLFEQPSPVTPGAKWEILIPNVGGLQLFPLSVDTVTSARPCFGASVLRAGYQFLSPNGVNTDPPA